MAEPTPRYVVTLDDFKVACDSYAEAKRINAEELNGEGAIDEEPTTASSARPTVSDTSSRV